MGALDQSRGDDADDFFAFDSPAAPAQSQSPPPAPSQQAPPPPTSSTQAPPAPAAPAPGLGPPPPSRPHPAVGEKGPAAAEKVPGGVLAGRDDVATRVVTGVIAAGVLLAAAAVGPGALLIVVAAALTMAAAELFQALRARGYQPATLLGLVGTAGMVIGAFAKGETALPVVPPSWSCSRSSGTWPGWSRPGRR